jgi:hypothetical protein
MRVVLRFPDGSTQYREVDSNKVLGAVAIPSYYEAGALSGKPLTDFGGCDWHNLIIVPASFEFTENADVGIDIDTNCLSFGRMLAKIALGSAVAHFGLHGFNPTVRAFILGEVDQCGYWVGGYAGTAEAVPDSSLFHDIRVKATNLRAGAWIIVEIQLFAQYGGPRNYVVVGKAK